MVVREQHIHLDMLLKRNSGNVFLRMKDQEKDWWLNEAVAQYMQDRRNIVNDPKKLGLQQTKKRYEDLSDLLKTIPLDVYKATDRSVVALFPHDFNMFNGFGVGTLDDCGTGIVHTETSTSLKYVIVPFTIPVDKFASYTINEIEPGDVVGRNLLTRTGAILDDDLSFEILREVLWTIRKNSDVQIYWEKWNDIVAENSYIFVYPTSTTVTKIRVNATDYVLTSQAFTRITSNSTSSYLSAGRLVKTEELNDILKYSFSKTKHTSVVSIMDGKGLELFHDTTFVINSVDLTYFRNPRPINLSLGWNCDLKNVREITLLASGLIAIAKNLPNGQDIVKQILTNT